MRGLFMICIEEPQKPKFCSMPSLSDFRDVEDRTPQSFIHPTALLLRLSIHADAFSHSTCVYIHAYIHRYIHIGMHVYTNTNVHT